MTRIVRMSLPAVLLLGACTAVRPSRGAGGPPGTDGAVALSVAPDQPIAPVDRNVLGGFNFSNGMQVAEFGEDLRAVKAAELRFPGGEVGDRNDLSEFALGIFRSNLAMLGDPGAVIQTRVGARTYAMSTEPPHNRPEDAADAARWAKAKGIRVRYWEIGNEPDIYALTQQDPSFTPERYCEVFRAQAAAIRSVDPTARVAGPAVSGGTPGRDRFLEAFVKECGDVVDVLTWHLYPTSGELDDAAALATVTEADTTTDAYRALWADPVRNPRGYGRTVALGVTEYGLSWMTSRSHHLADLTAAMWAMEVALRLDAHGVDSAHYFAFQGMTNHGLLDQAGVRRPTWYAFTLLATLSGDLVAASTSDPELWAHAARDGSRLDVVVTNRARASKALRTRVAGFALESGTYFDEAVVRDEKPPAPVRPGAEVTLPARSVVHLVYRKG
jgi:hypothetical protein